ncbi:IS1 family transposase [Aeromonas rivipollensis]|uniref:IS1 family transposase n=1 Tax=Aeromonas rivipollensis TaxID=948519 RepID=UPI003D1FBD51
MTVQCPRCQSDQVYRRRKTLVGHARYQSGRYAVRLSQTAASNAHYVEWQYLLSKMVTSQQNSNLAPVLHPQPKLVWA